MDNTNIFLILNEYFLKNSIVFNKTRLSMENRGNTRNKKNRLGLLKRINRWNVFAFVFIASVITIVYVNNVVTVNKLLKANQDRRKELETIRNENAFLKTTLNQLQSPERITQIAQSEFGMTKIETAPLLISDEQKK